MLMRIGFMIGVSTVLVAAQAAAQTSTGVAASVRIEQPAAIVASHDLVFAVTAPALASAPVVRTAAPASSAPSTASLIQTASSALVPVVPGAVRASFVVAGDGGQSISVVVPENVALVRDGGIETATLTTDTSIADGPQFLAGSFGSGGTLSFDVGGQVTLSRNAAMAGTYNGVLAVVAQYN